ncbi:MAG: hypothetical protein ACK4UN_10610 [Limisphaerales bacterium]
MKRGIIILSALLIALIFLNQRTPLHRDASKEEENQGTTEAFKSRNNETPSRITQAIALSTGDEGEMEDEPELTLAQIESYLLKAKRSPESLLNAFIQTGDMNYLAEAAKDYPENSLVQWAMVFHSSPEERSQWVDALKKSFPDSGLPNYLSALDLFRSGDVERGVAELNSARGKKVTSKLDVTAAMSREEMYLLLGYSPLQAKESLFPATELPIERMHLPEMKKLSNELVALLEKYRRAGDIASQHALAQIGIETARHISSGEAYLLNRLVGFSMEADIMKHFDPGTYYDFLGSSPEQRQLEMREARDDIREMFRSFEDIYQQMNEGEKLNYWNRVQVYGESNALQWLNATYKN